MTEYRIEVAISLKPGMTDAEGETVAKSLGLLGFDVKKAETVKTYVLAFDAKSEREALKEAESACQRLLANPVIHDYSVKVV